MSASNPSNCVSLLAGMLAGIGASACCAGPLVVVSLGLGGAWVSLLTTLEPLRPLFIILALLFFAMAFHRLYRESARCAPGEACASDAVRRRQRLLFWLSLGLTVAVVAFPWYAPLFY